MRGPLRHHGQDAALGDDLDAIAQPEVACQRLPEQRFNLIVAVDVGMIETADAQIEAPSDEALDFSHVGTGLFD